MSVTPVTNGAVHDDELARWLEGDVTVERAAEIEALAARDPALRVRIDELRAIIGGLAIDASFDDVDLLPGVRAALALPTPRTPSMWTPRRVGAFAAPALLAAAAALVMVVSNDDAIRTKGAAVDRADPSTWAGVRAFHADPTGRLLPLEATLGADEGLAFSYTNAGPAPFQHLMIFAVDAAGAVHWYWPAFVDAATDPQAVPLRSGSDVELGEVVRHDLPAGRLSLYAAFLHAPLHVSSVEEAVRRAADAGALRGQPPARFDLDGADASYWQVFSIDVVKP